MQRLQNGDPSPQIPVLTESPTIYVHTYTHMHHFFATVYIIYIHTVRVGVRVFIHTYIQLKVYIHTCIQTFIHSTCIQVEKNNDGWHIIWYDSMVVHAAADRTAGAGRTRSSY